MFDEIQSLEAMQALADVKRAHVEAYERLQRWREKEKELVMQVHSCADQERDARDAIENMCGEK